MSADKPIKVLSAELANQIAAGEVVERPASVVKELVENSLDAGATEITVEIEQGGQKRILIRDNGKGIEKAQLTLALSRHATSKIENINDLESITSMGFRGEALASISSVSRLTLTSKPNNQTEAWQAQAEGKQMDVKVTPAAHPNGTSIEVLDLFFNTPARRKFLKTGKTEFQHIEQLIKRLSLTRPDVKFVLTHNQKRCFNYLKTKHFSQRIEQVCGKKFLEQCVPVKYDFETIHLVGFASKIGVGLPTRDNQYIFVNGRMMKDKLIAHALRQAYEDTLPGQSFPAYVLFLTLPPNQLDVNVHPAKHEVRFHQSRQIHDLVYKAITQSIGMSDMSHDEPAHDYILPLQNKNSPTNEPQENVVYDEHQTSSSQSKPNAYLGYHSTTANPSARSVKATNDFYASTNNTPISSSRIDNAIAQSLIPKKSTNAKKTGIETSESINTKQSLNHNALLCKPFIIFNSTNIDRASSVCILHLQALATEFVRTRILESTQSQPLLMPVSSAYKERNASVLKEANIFETLKGIQFEVVHSHQKLILKQVPSGIRQLPWASIFAKIDFVDMLAGQTDFSANRYQALFESIANAWISVQDINNSTIDAWLSVISQEALSELLKKQSVDIDINEIYAARTLN